MSKVKVTSWYVICELSNGKAMKVADMPDFAAETMDEHLSMLEDVDFFNQSEITDDDRDPFKDIRATSLKNIKGAPC